MHGSDLMLSYQSWIIVTIEGWTGPHPFTQSGKLVNPETKYFTDGATGSGKTFLACALGHNACRQGYKVYYYRLKALMEQCYQGMLMEDTANF
ncbi:Transposase [Escherichia coli O25b:H4]|uniref:Transposase n=1 Tax=Escherichia coli O25b:H4 TaxID=941280 RepID=A0A192C6F1_ECO25|nr:Transposase [Escherichia coli O25b:H4]